MSFEKVCAADEVWEGEMQAFAVGGQSVLIVNADGGVLRAFSGLCPHQDYPLTEGELKGTTLTCKMHMWRFNVETGLGINPSGCRLKQFPVKVEHDTIYVALDQD